MATSKSNESYKTVPAEAFIRIFITPGCGARRI
jgi:hypothetical protein